MLCDFWSKGGMAEMADGGSQGMAALAMTKRESAQLAFDIFDRDGDGTMDIAELKAGVKSMGVVVSDRELEEMVAFADVDGNGTLDFEEFFELLHHGGATDGQTRVLSEVMQAQNWTKEDIENWRAIFSTKKNRSKYNVFRSFS